MEKLKTRKTASLIDTKGMTPQKKKQKSIIKHSLVPLTNKQGIINPKRQPVFREKVEKNQGKSGSKDQKERKTASTLTRTFFEQKITTVQIDFCNNR